MKRSFIENSKQSNSSRILDRSQKLLDKETHGTYFRTNIFSTIKKTMLLSSEKRNNNFAVSIILQTFPVPQNLYKSGKYQFELVFFNVYSNCFNYFTFFIPVWNFYPFERQWIIHCNSKKIYLPQVLFQFDPRPKRDTENSKNNWFART